MGYDTRKKQWTRCMADNPATCTRHGVHQGQKVGIADKSNLPLAPNPYSTITEANDEILDSLYSKFKEQSKTPEDIEAIEDPKTLNVPNSITNSTKETTGSQSLEEMHRNFSAAKKESKVHTPTHPHQFNPQERYPTREEEVRWADKYHTAYGSINKDAISATRKLFETRPSSLGQEECHAAFSEWISEVSEAYGAKPPTLVWSDETRTAEYDSSSHTINMNPDKRWIMSLMTATRVSLQQNAEIDNPVSRTSAIDARAWTLSMYEETKPELLRKLSAEKRIPFLATVHDRVTRSRRSSSRSSSRSSRSSNDGVNPFDVSNPMNLVNPFSPFSEI